MWHRYLAAIALTCCMVSAASAATQKIMIVTWRGCEEACLGFQESIKARGIDAEFLLRDADRKTDRLPGIREEARSGQVDLVVTWGTTVTRSIAGTLAEMDRAPFNHAVPVVFMIVADPVGAGIVNSLEQTGRDNVAGTYNRVPEKVNIETIRAYLPGFKRLGMLFNRNENNSVLKHDEVAALSASMGFELISRELPLGDDGKPRVEDIAPKLAELKAEGIDFLYFGSSSFLRDNHERLTGVAVENGIPVLSPYEGLVRESQALVSVSARYREVGRLAAEQAEKILVQGVKPGGLPVAKVTRFAVVINMNVAKKLKRFPPLGLLQIAETVN